MEPSGPLALDPLGTVRFVRPDERDTVREALDRAGWVVAELDGIGPSIRGRLGDVIDDAIEGALRARGEAGPGVAIAGLGSSASLAQRETALSDQMYRARRAGAKGIAVVLGPLRAAAGPLGALEPQDCATLRWLAKAAPDPPILVLLDARDARTQAYGDPMPLEQVIAADSVRFASTAVGQSEGFATAAPAQPSAHRTPANVVDADREIEPSIRSAAAAEGDRSEPWRTWALQLSAARGPQPLGVLEKLFTESYVPLNGAIASGLDDPRAKGAHDEFRNTFVKSYTDAFATFAATTKRPRMVLEVHDLAGRIARLHGARSTRLLLVDGMRWDVSRLVQERLAVKLGSRAVLADELLLWSALPTTTMRQLETIARGVEALRVPDELEADAEPHRGRTAEYVRRLRVGPREIHKLDLVESRLGSARGAVMRVLPEIADATADVIARHAETLVPHTLLFVFGDHGFSIDRNGSAQQGGASPEEVLVGAFALLVGDVH